MHPSVTSISDSTDVEALDKSVIVARLGLSGPVLQNQLVASALDALRFSPLLREGFPVLPKRIPRKRDDYKCGNCGMKKRNHNCTGVPSDAVDIPLGPPLKKRRQAFKPLTVMLQSSDTAEIQAHFQEIKEVGEANVKVNLIQSEGPTYQIYALGSWLGKPHVILGSISENYMEYVRDALTDQSLMNIELAALVERQFLSDKAEQDGFSPKNLVGQLMLFRNKSWRTKHLSEAEYAGGVLPSTKSRSKRSRDDDDDDDIIADDDDLGEDGSLDEEDSTGLQSQQEIPQLAGYPMSSMYLGGYAPASSAPFPAVGQYQHTQIPPTIPYAKRQLSFPPGFEGYLSSSSLGPGSSSPSPPPPPTLSVPTISSTPILVQPTASKGPWKTSSSSPTVPPTYPAYQSYAGLTPNFSRYSPSSSSPTPIPVPIVPAQAAAFTPYNFPYIYQFASPIPPSILQQISTEDQNQHQSVEQLQQHHQQDDSTKHEILSGIRPEEQSLKQGVEPANSNSAVPTSLPQPLEH